jgi:hypothetical protein
MSLRRGGEETQDHDHHCEHRPPGRPYRAALPRCHRGAGDAAYLCGDRLDFYVALAEIPDTSPGELATRVGIAERYAREWLEQQAVAGLLDVVRDDGDPATRRYRLPAEVAEVMTQADSLNYLAPLAPLVASLAQILPAVLEAFRTGGGVPYKA